VLNNNRNDPVQPVIMGCRKNAYRALTEMSEWMEAQREKNEEKFKALAEAQRKFWTPASVFDGCCSKWLADGPEIQPSGYQAGSSLAAKGCSGACGKGHPRITLEWKNKPGAAVATVSHDLDPFVKYFEELCHGGFARKSERNKMHYELKGFLKEHMDKLEQSAPFGMHLVKVTSSALAASQRAHKRHLEREELEQHTKRRKMQGESVNSILLEQVLEICYNHSLLQHLDVAEIAWMRLSCRTMSKVAVRMAKARMQSVKLSYSVLFNGRVVPETMHVNRPEESFGEESWGGVCDKKISGTHVERYIVGLPFRLVLKESSYGVFHPENDTRVNWQSPRLGLTEANDEEVDVSDYRGHVVRLFLEPTLTVTKKNEMVCPLPEKDCLFSRLVEIGRFPLESADMKQSGELSSKIVYHVENYVEENDSKTIQCAGDISIQSVKFGFEDLLGVYVCKKLPMAKAKMHEIQQQRPATRAEKHYVKALAKAAREAPVSLRDFVGFEGW